MLVFTRGVGESFFVGDNIEVILLDLERNRARIGIIAPRNVPVHRAEVYERIKRELGAVAVTPAGDVDGNVFVDFPAGE